MMVFVLIILFIFSIVILVLIIAISEEKRPFMAYLLFLYSFGTIGFTVFVLDKYSISKQENRAIELNYAEYDSKTGKFKWTNDEGRYIITGYKEIKEEGVK